MNEQEHWAAFCKTGSVAQYLAYKAALAKCGKEQAHASVDRRDHCQGNYSTGER